MNEININPGIALLCDEQGRVKEILHDDLAVSESIPPGSSFVRLADPGNLNKAKAFLLALQSHQVAFDWRLDMRVQDRRTPSYFAGLLLKGEILVLAHPINPNILDDEALMRIANEQITTLRATAKELARLNSELKHLNEEKSRALQNAMIIIAERKQAEQALRTSEARFKSMFNESPLGIAVVDSLTARFYSVNPAFAKIAGRTVEEMEQIDWLSITHPEDIKEDLDRMALMNAGKIPGFQMEKRYRRPDGSYVWINMTIAPMYVEDKTHPRHLLMIEEITERRALQEGLKNAILSAQRAKERAESANHTKDEFIAVLSHELRTPLTPVLATVSALQEQGKMPASLLPDMELIRRNVEMEVALIDDLLDVTRISRGTIVLHLETVDVHDCIKTAVEICRAEISGKRLEIKSELHAEQHHVWADPARLRQVFWNLLKNAVKFTPPGGRITLRTLNIGGRVQIEMSDQGIGIEPDLMPRIFNLFEQGEQSRIRQFGGLGLGLHIARTVVELLEGRLSAFSEGRNQGATFTVELATLPPRGKAAPPAPAGEPQERRLRILLVDDHHDTLQCLTKLIRKWGHTVVTAENVRSARELAGEQAFDLLISDLGLPDGSGLDVMRHVKERTGIPGIALSGFGTEEDIRQSRAAGFAEHLVKPVNIAALRAVIRHFADTGP